MPNGHNGQLITITDDDLTRLFHAQLAHTVTVLNSLRDDDDTFATSDEPIDIYSSLFDFNDWLTALYADNNPDGLADMLNRPRPDDHYCDAAIAPAILDLGSPYFAD